MGGGAWPFLVGRVRCLVSHHQERSLRPVSLRPVSGLWLCVLGGGGTGVCIDRVSVCTFKTTPCVPAPRPHVSYMWAWCRYTRGRFECTHGCFHMFFTVPHHTTPHTPITHHDHQRHHDHITQHGDRNRERQRKRDKKREDETRRQEKRREEMKKKREEEERR